LDVVYHVGLGIYESLYSEYFDVSGTAMQFLHIVTIVITGNLVRVHVVVTGIFWLT